MEVKKIKIHRIKMAIAMVAVMLLVACSSGGDAPEAPPTPPTDPTEPTTPTTPEATSQLEIPIYVSMSAGLFEDGKGRQANRAWAPPTDYYLYSNLYGLDSYVNQPNLGQSTIDLFMTYDGTGKLPTDPNPLHARLSYNSSTEKWKLGLPHGVDETRILSGDYYAYGFVPKDAADNATIAKLEGSSNWADGAVLTIQGLKAVATDPCVMIGAKHGFAVQRAENVFDYYDGGYIDKDEPANGYDDGTDERTNRLRAGDFRFYLNTGKTEDKINPNYLFFLFDHLYSALNISMKVDEKYDELRHIKLKELKLRTVTSGSVSPYKSDVIITLTANGTGTNPITSISYDNIDNTPTDGVIYSNSSGFPLTTAYSLFLGHFMPNGVTTLILTSTYDVYDTKGNLVRQGCKATNTLLISKLFNEQDESKRGWKYTVRLVINPTYLYVMSDPDLDNPTVTVE